jgi:gamma-D-glutamyl-L-lysine dipeptidyl-peptidase
MRPLARALFIPFILAAIIMPLHADTDPTFEEQSQGEIRRGEDTAVSGEQRARQRFERAAVKVEPSLQGDPARAQVYVDFFPSQFLNDPRLFPFSVTAAPQPDGTIALSGYVGFPENHDTLRQFLGALQLEISEDSIEVLPSENLGPLKFAFINTTAAPYYAQPDESSERVTVGLLGEPVFLLRRQDNDYYLAMGNEGYIGNIHADNIVTVAADDFDAMMAKRRARVDRDVSTPDGRTLPAGAILFLQEPAASGLAANVTLPDGATVPVARDALTLLADTPPDIETALATAHRLMGTPYLWGGRSSEGIDCSGLVQTSFRTVGISLPRDSNQQALVGTLTGTRWHRSAMQRGDLVFFIGRTGTIVHTGIYLGDGKYIEAAGPGVQITSLKPGDENYSERRDRTFVFSKRVIE